MDFEVEIDKARSPLSPAENRVYQLLVEGKTQAAMTLVLHRSIKTVETHITHIYQKLNVENDKQAITAGFVQGFVKARKALVMCLIVSSAGNAVLPSQAYASPDEPGTDIPMNRLVMRGGVRARTGSRLQLRRPTRRRED